RPLCRPIHDDTQKPTYSGYKRVHGLKIHRVVFPNGLLCDLCGPVTGNRHEARNCLACSVRWHCILQPSHVKRVNNRTANIQPGQVASNRAMSVTRIST
ncbi:unnamed protein product, partial [Discosporangium mesarthrocarpum]